MHAFSAGLHLVALDQLPAVLLDYVLYPSITLLMCLLSVFVVLGNLLVVTAIWHESQLHSVTNYLIASLAAADCLVGALVMPFSIISEMIVGSWTFGATWCDLWHSFDVLASTASIMNLCAISLDRYLAITNPICYPTKMTPKRVALLIVSLWTCSSLISFPAILWWRAVGEGTLQQVSPPTNTTTSTRERALHQQEVIASTGRPPPGSQLDEFRPREQGEGGRDQQQQQQTNNQPATTTTSTESLGDANNVISKLDPGRAEQYAGQYSPESSSSGGGDDHLGSSTQIQSSSSTTQTSSSHQPFNLNQSDLQAISGAGLGSSEAILEPQFKCFFTDDTYYLLFSSFVSFYGPLCVMLYAYICIYKAAVQQTRFLKHGSKQVMIGGSGGGNGGSGGGYGGGGGGSGGLGDGSSCKKNKRHRHASEHSHLGDADRCTGSAPNSTAANCDGSCDNYERQHLVLRAHRGGGGGGVVSSQNSKSSSAGTDSSSRRPLVSVSVSASATSASSSPATTAKQHLRGLAYLKSRHKKSHSKASEQQQQPKQASLTDDDGDDEEEDESELDKRHEQPVSSSLDQTSNLSDSFNGTSAAGAMSTTRVSPPNSSWSSQEANQGRQSIVRCSSSSANRSHRISMTQSRRDKMRVESQRFTSSSAAVSPVEQSKTQNTTTGFSQQVAGARDETSLPASPGASNCWKKPQMRLTIARDSNQNHCDSLEDNHELSASPRQLSGGSSSTGLSGGGLNQTDIECQTVSSGGGAAFRFVNALRRGDPSRAPPLPASLVPLIMMNSDTSTDSSIVTVVTRPTGDGPVQTSVTSKPTAGQPDQDQTPGYALNLATNTNQRADLTHANSDTASTRSSLESTPETRATTTTATSAARRTNQVTINLSFDETPERRKLATNAAASKGQILHYDSDKLIQSIVDLTNIHYIDCTAINNNNSSGNNNNNNKNGNGNSQPTGTGEAKPNSIHQDQANHSPQTKGILTRSPLASATSDHHAQVVSLEMHQDHSHQNHQNHIGANSTSEHEVSPSGKVPSSTRTFKARTGRQSSPRTEATLVPRQHRSMGRKLTKLAKERKAAKTLGIVVGVFILCWLPFFVVNILVALCGRKCIYKPEILFSVVTWLGWLNSAMNPVIYACWSRDFRRAFRRVLCTWVEFLCYDGTRLARKLKLKKSSGYSANAHEVGHHHHSSRPASSTQRSGASIEINHHVGGGGGVSGGGVNGGANGQGGGYTTSGGGVARTGSNNHSHRGLLSDQ